MRKQRNDFASKEKSSSYIDEDEDWGLIVSSFAQMYGIRLMSEDCDITVPEYYMLLQSLNSDTPLGQIVSIRAETNKDVMKHWGSAEKRIRIDWMNRKGREQVENDPDAAISELKNALIKAFG